MKRPSRRERGFILGYIMLALALLGLVTALLSRLQDQQAVAQWVERAQATLRDNIQVIHSQIMYCAASNMTEEAGLVAAMPPSSDPTVGDLLTDVLCFPSGGPGNPLFDGTNTVFAPRPPQGFSDWRYVNSLPTAPNGEIYVYTSTSDPNGIAAANRLRLAIPGDRLQVTNSSGVSTVTFFLRRPPSELSGDPP